MAKIAKLVWVSVGTRVIVEESATDAEVWAAAEAGFGNVNSFPYICKKNSK